MQKAKEVVSLLICCLLCCFFGCKPDFESIDTSGELPLQFSTDSILFDTLLTGKVSITRRVRVYNLSDKALEIPLIYLGSGQDNPYIISINGIEKTRFEQVKLFGKDSLYVLIKLLVNNRGIASPFLLEDSIVFSNQKSSKSIQLRAWGRDAIYYTQNSIACTNVWDSTAARFVYSDIEIPEGCTLDILPGTHIYVQNKASIKVKGTLRTFGTAQQWIHFSGPRLEAAFKNLPGQWNGIVLEGNQAKVELLFTEIKNCISGIASQSQQQGGVCDLKQVGIFNCTQNGIQLKFGTLNAENLILANCGKQAILAQGGGTYNIQHLTAALYGYNFTRSVPTLSFSGAFESSDLKLQNPLNFKLINSIIWGVLENEINIATENSIPLTLEIENNVLKTNLNTFSNTNKIFNFKQFPSDDPIRFQNPFELDFQPDSLSPATKMAKTGLSIDYRAKNRPSQPTSGALEP